MVTLKQVLWIRGVVIEGIASATPRSLVARKIRSQIPTYIAPIHPLRWFVGLALAERAYDMPLGQDHFRYLMAHPVGVIHKAINDEGWDRRPDCFVYKGKRVEDYAEVYMEGSCPRPVLTEEVKGFRFGETLYIGTRHRGGGE